MVYSFVKENKLMVALAILLAVIAGVSTLWDFQTKASAQGNGNNNQASEEEDEGNGNGQLQGNGALCGFAWGSTDEATASRNGAGWVSFNSQDCDTDDNGTISSTEASAHPGCPAGATANYGVVADSNGNLQGYAWSSNLGWLKFGSLSGMPSGGSNQQNARIDGNGNGDNNVSGWSRFCAGTTTGDCSGSDRTDGWDGWLSMRDTNAGGRYGVTFNGTTQKFAGYSWGGPVVGWLKWDQTGGNGVRYCSTTTTNLSVSFSADPDVSHTGTLESTLTAVASVSGATFQFECNTGQGLSTGTVEPGNSATYPCTYGVGTFTPHVKVVYSGQTVNEYDTVTVDNGGGPGPGNGALSATCFIVDAPGDYVAGDQATVNRPVEWRANVSNDGSAPGPYNYVFSFDDNGTGGSTDFGGAGDEPDQIFNGVSASNQSASRTYRILGRKYARVTVSDPAEGVDSGVVNCTPIPLNVVVNPRIIEI